LVRSFGRTYGLPYVIAFPSNVFGPRQAEEKLIPKVIVSALRGDKIPLYGSGNQTRQWSYVVSTAKNLIALAELADVEESYHLPHCEDLSNLELISHILAALKECGYNRSLSDLLKRVDDRRGHDFGYNSDYTKFHLTIPYEKMHFGSLEEWLTPTVAWYVSRYGEHAKKDL
jgi:dTDP-glucose 4,6-dehydratase